jgi:hypothetical protein
VILTEEYLSLRQLRRVGLHPSRAVSPVKMDHLWCLIYSGQLERLWTLTEALKREQTYVSLFNLKNERMISFLLECPETNINF